MATITTFPFLQPLPERIQIVAWQIAPEPMQDHVTLRDWDPATPIAASCTVLADHDGILADTSLPRGAEIALALSWESEGTGLKGCGQVFPLPEMEEQTTLELQLLIPPGHAAARVTLFVTASLGKTLSVQPRVASPFLAGSVLWRTERTLALEGTAARFPTEIVDFSGLGWLPENASWHLDWDPTSPGNILLRSVRLRINARKERVAQAVSRANSREPEVQAILSVIYRDVGRSLIAGMLRCTDFVDEPGAFPKGTVGHHVAALVRLYFPGRSFDSLASLLRNRPEEFEAEIQSRLGLFSYGEA